MDNGSTVTAQTGIQAVVINTVENEADGRCFPFRAMGDTIQRCCCCACSVVEEEEDEEEKEDIAQSVFRSGSGDRDIRG